METSDLTLKALATGGILYRIGSILASGMVLLLAVGLARLGDAEKFLAFPLLGYKTKLLLLVAAAFIGGYLAISIGRAVFGPILGMIRRGMAKAFPKWLPWSQMAAFDHNLLNRIAGEVRVALDFEPFKKEHATEAEWDSFVRTMALFYLLRSSDLYQISEFMAFRQDLSAGIATALLFSAPFAPGIWKLWSVLAGVVFLLLVIPIAERWPIFFGQVISTGYLSDHFGAKTQPNGPQTSGH